MNTETIKYKKLIIEIGKKLYAKGYCDGTSGNISQKIDEGCLVTASGTNLGNLNSEDIVYVPFKEVPRTRFHKKPTSELFMHVALYMKRPEIDSIVHAHPHYCTAFGVARVNLNPPLLPEVLIQLGEIPLVEYAMPSTEELAYKIAAQAGSSNGLLMANHGAVTLGKNLEEAYYRMETLESYAQIVFLAKQLGRVCHISDEEMEKLATLKLKTIKGGK
ncbi:MAG: class II aldolase/adducin family protein [Cyanobacteriota bacterium]